MKKSFKIGLGVLLPILLVFQVILWLYNLLEGVIEGIMPQSLDYQWWYAIVFFVGILIAIVIIGFIFSFIRPAKWAKDKIEKYIVNNIPVINKIYNFGKDIADSLITDIKEDGDLQVVEVDFAGQKSIGALTDVENGIVFIPTAPNPLNGFLIKTHDYKFITGMTFLDLVKTLASLGRVGGSDWK